MDVSTPPEAVQFMKNMVFCPPTSVVAKVQKQWPHLRAKQIYRLWTQLSVDMWRRDPNPMVSAKKFIEEWPEADLWEFEMPKGVVALAWGMKGIGERIGKAIVETGIDATCTCTSRYSITANTRLLDNTNQGELELYALLGEYDNAGYPLAYMLLSTASSIADKKRTIALTKFLQAVRDNYHVNPRFNHVDKDFAEIAALKTVWPDAKIQICWWHLKRALNQRTCKAKLSTTPYNPEDAKREFAFVDVNFIPVTPPDPKEDEEYAFGDNERNQKRKKKKRTRTKATEDEPSSEPPLVPQVPDFLIKLPSLAALRARPKEAEDDAQSTGEQDDDESSIGDAPTEYEDDDDLEVDVQPTKHQFCPEGLRKTTIFLLERHYCAHPDIPGMSRPDAAGIRAWAVKQMYTYCENHDLRELWAYLWGNWYRPGRWELWARSSCAEIPHLKTNMICESQYVYFVSLYDSVLSSIAD